MPLTTRAHCACGAGLAPYATRCAACGAVIVPSSAATLPPESAPAAATVPGSAGDAAAHAPKSQGQVATAIPTASEGPLPAPDTGPLKPGMAFGTRYHVKRLLGLGGMGAVYQAWDTELSVDVAIKLIRPEIIADPRAAAEIQGRFKRELLLARLVTHPNVVRIHDLGEIDGIKYITMSYVDGVDLASILEAEGRLEVQRTLRIAREVLNGLVAAHAAGVVHRDLKPANIMVGRGDEALIMDFGIARMTADAASVEEVRPAEAGPLPTRSLGARFGGMTRVGSLVGTVEYMAPEQAGGSAVDQRADIYAFGLIVYDMLAGPVRRLAATNPRIEFDARMKAAPATLRQLRPQVPEALDAIIRRCIEPDRNRRFPSSVALAQALDRLDANGRRIPAWKSVGAFRLVVVGAAVLAATSLAWWWVRPVPPPPPKDPVSVVIADIGNATQDASFDRALEPILKLSLEGANFITAFGRSDLKRGLGVAAPVVFDAVAARELAVKQGVNVVVAGTIEPAGTGYHLRLVATQAIAGTTIVSAEGNAARKEEVLGEAVALTERVRRALGDDASDSKKRFAMDTLTTVSLAVVRDYADAMESLSSSRFAEARGRFARAVQADPNFGLAYAGLAIASQNLGNETEARNYATQALRHLDRMTERERFRTRGLYYLVTADYPSCAKEYGALIAKFPADAGARNNVALCETHLREMQKALAEMRESIRILPQRALYRVNLALYLGYAGEFDAALPEALKAREMSPFGYVPLGFAQTGLDQLEDAAATYAQFSSTGPVGASHAASALADLAVYRGRYAEAIRILQAGAAADLAAGTPARAAAKYAAVAHAELSRARPHAAAAAARRALAASSAFKIRFLAARVLAQAGMPAEARVQATQLAGDLEVEPRTYAKMIEAELLLAANEPRKAIVLLAEANGMLDTWIGRHTLGRAYVAAGAWPQADSEFDRCIVRRGEALALFLDEEPTWGFMPSVYYYRGRVLQALGADGYADAYRRYLEIRGSAGEDPLLAEIRGRVGRAPDNSGARSTPGQ